VADTKDDQRLARFELYLATAEKVSDRCFQATAWILSVNSCQPAPKFRRSSHLKIPKAGGGGFLDQP
jgi:hypothetical protein